MPDAPDRSPATHQDEILLLAEKLGEALDRLNKIESEFTAQTAPLDAAGASIGAANTALQAALKGIEQLSFHVLDNNLGAVSKRLESHEKLTAAEHRALAEKTDQIRIALADATKSIVTRFEKLETQRHEFTQSQSSEVDRVRAEFSAGQKTIAGIVDTLTAQLADTRREFAEPKSLNPAGKWDAQHAGGYDRLDVVSLNGTSYISKIDGNTEKPSKTSSAWTVLSSRGGSVLGGGGATDITGVAGMGATGLQIAQSPTPDEARDILGVNDFTGATALADGTPGRVIQPIAGDQNKYLRADGTWSTVSSVTAPAASQSTVNAGLVDNEYVSPKTNEVRTLAGDATRQTAPYLLFPGITGNLAAFQPGANGAVSGGKWSIRNRIRIPSTPQKMALYSWAGSAGGVPGTSQGAQFYSDTGTANMAFTLFGATSSDSIIRVWSGVQTTYAGQLVTVDLEYDPSTGPTLYINGSLQTAVATDVTAGTTPAWSTAFTTTWLTFASSGTANVFSGAATFPVLVNGLFTAAEILTHAQTGLLPDWCAGNTGSVVAQTSGVLVVGAKYRIKTFVTGDSFTNVGAASNATGVEFVATGTTPTTWTNASSLQKIAVIMDPFIGPNYAIRDRSSNGLHGMRSSNTNYVGPALDGDMAATVAHSGSGNLQFLGTAFFDTSKGWVLRGLLVNSTAAVTFSLGNASGGAQYVNNFSLAVGDNYIDAASFVSRLISGANLWSKSSAAATITIFPDHKRTT